MGIEIRYLDKNDLADVERLFIDSFKNDHIYNECGFNLTNGLPDNFKVSIQYSIESGESIGYFEDSKLIAFAIGFDYNECAKYHPEVMKAVFEVDDAGNSPYSELDPFFSECNNHNNLYYLMSIAVELGKRREGIASKLLDFLITHSNKDIISDVSSMISLPMYEHRGFKISSLGTDYKLVILSH